MKFYEITFSPTGGTKRAADILSRGLSEQILEIDLCDRNQDFSAVALEEDDIALIAVPSYGGAPPRLPSIGWALCLESRPEQFLCAFMGTGRMTTPSLSCWMAPAKPVSGRLQRSLPLRNTLSRGRLRQGGRTRRMKSG
ncbi:MAG: hypothetical protein LUE21_05445 [Oscillospiraceae bacterium]|nr:hypothetical protein [Oscillospiraceae bacterium]